MFMSSVEMEAMVLPNSLRERKASEKNDHQHSPAIQEPSKKDLRDRDVPAKQKVNLGRFLQILSLNDNLTLEAKGDVPGEGT